MLHFGLGEEGKVDSVVIRWPRGIMQTLVKLTINTLYQINEPAK
ncbi:MAG: hypothetical protein NVSMB53_10660 [Gemmatimonadaceae bacterium]